MSIISEDFSFNINSFLKIKEINLEYKNNIDFLKNDIETLEFLKLKGDKVFIQINNNFYSFIFFNLNDNIKENQIIEKFNVTKFERLYKERLNWNLVTNCKQTSDNIFEYIENVRILLILVI